jgi:hypothetical protein
LNTPSTLYTQNQRAVQAAIEKEKAGKAEQAG